MVKELENPLMKCLRPTKLELSEPCGITDGFKNEGRIFTSVFLLPCLLIL